MSDQLKVEGKSGLASSKVKICICCVCLGEASDEDDEIVECDGCGVSVHEGCYGISESHSIASTESSASTEPWFCDACKAGVKPSCEMCPNSGGIYKETDTGRWVHIVCALYIPGVAFGDVDKLSPVTLFEMSYSVWGAKACSICEEERFSRTGVCISCDAGMCRTYFHVTCAQRQGLLSEASPDEDIADPFYAYCKVHADKFTVKSKKRNWLAIQSRVKQHAEEGKNLDSKEKLRVERKLRRHRQKFLAAKAKRPPPWVPKEKIPRFLTTSPAAVRRMMKKAELLGINPQVPNSTSSKGEHKTRWHVAPALSAEFASYYLDRNVKMSNIKTQMKELLVQNNKLQDQERILRIQYDQVSGDGKQLNLTNTRLRHEAEKLQRILGDLLGKKLPVPEVLKPKKVIRSPTRRETPRSPPPIIHPCGICKTSRDQHLLAKCDSCKNHYHLGCLDPPLSRMPKKTKLQGWQCSECADTSSDDSEHKGIDSKAPMRLRDKIKAPVKFTPPHLQPDFFKNKREKKKYPKTKKKVAVKRKLEGTEEEVPKMETKSEEIETTPVPVKKPKASYVKKVKKIDVRTECCVCNLPGTNGNLVRCDMCKLCYHFECLDPPRKKTPKQRGYSWHCEACDSGEDQSEDEDMEEEMEKEVTPSKPDTTYKEKTPDKEKGLDAESSEQKSVKKKQSPAASGEGRRSRSPKGKGQSTPDHAVTKSDKNEAVIKITSSKSNSEEEAEEEEEKLIPKKKRKASGSPGSRKKTASPKSAEKASSLEEKLPADSVSPKKGRNTSPKGEGSGRPRSKTPTKSSSPKSSTPGLLISPSKDLLLKAKPVIEVEDIKSPTKIRKEKNTAALAGDSSPRSKTGVPKSSPGKSKSQEEQKKSAKNASPKGKTSKEGQSPTVKVTPEKISPKEEKKMEDSKSQIPETDVVNTEVEKLEDVTKKAADVTIKVVKEKKGTPEKKHTPEKKTKGKSPKSSETVDPSGEVDGKKSSPKLPSPKAKSPKSLENTEADAIKNSPKPSSPKGKSPKAIETLHSSNEADSRKSSSKLPSPTGKGKSPKNKTPEGKNSDKGEVGVKNIKQRTPERKKSDPVEELGEKGVKTKSPEVQLEAGQEDKTVKETKAKIQEGKKSNKEEISGKVPKIKTPEKKKSDEDENVVKGPNRKTPDGKKSEKDADEKQKETEKQTTSEKKDDTAETDVGEKEKDNSLAMSSAEAKAGEKDDNKGGKSTDEAKPADGAADKTEQEKPMSHDQEETQLKPVPATATDTHKTEESKVADDN